MNAWIDIGFLSIPLLYVLYSLRKQIYLFNPFLLPFIIFSIFYYIPSLMLIDIGQEIKLDLHNIILVLGSTCFLFGVLLIRWISTYTTNKNCFSNLLFIKGSPLWIAWLIGIGLLIIYGIWSGILMGILSGASVEGLRRQAEIGKGILEKPALYLASVPLLWLVARIFYRCRNSYCIIKSIVLILWTSGLIFLCIGNKSAALLPLVILLAIYNKYFRFNVSKLLAAVFIGILLIGTLNYVRRGGEDSGGSGVIEKASVVLTVYWANYIPIVNSVHNGTINFQYGKEYFSNALSIIPRFLYPNKPLSFDYYLKNKLGRNFEGGGLPPTFFGSLYLNFGLIGVIFGSMIIGGLYFWLYRIYLLKCPEISVISAYCMFYLLDPSQFIGKLEILFCIILCVWIFVFFMASAIKRPSATLAGAEASSFKQGEREIG